MKNLYLLFPKKQKILIKRYCFGKCGKIKVGGILYNGEIALPCTEDNCKYLDKQIKMNIPEKIFNDTHNIYLRKLVF